MEGEVRDRARVRPVVLQQLVGARVPQLNGVVGACAVGVISVSEMQRRFSRSLDRADTDPLLMPHRSCLGSIMC